MYNIFQFASITCAWVLGNNHNMKNIFVFHINISNMYTLSERNVQMSKFYEIKL